MANIEDFKIWFAIYWNEQKQAWKGSIRSREYPVREIAAKFGGGGHELAAGFSLSSLKEVKSVIEEVKKMLAFGYYLYTCCG